MRLRISDSEELVKQTLEVAKVLIRAEPNESESPEKLVETAFQIVLNVYKIVTEFEEEGHDK